MERKTAISKPGPLCSVILKRQVNWHWQASLMVAGDEPVSIIFCKRTRPYHPDGSLGEPLRFQDVESRAGQQCLNRFHARFRPEAVVRASITPAISRRACAVVFWHRMGATRGSAPSTSRGNAMLFETARHEPLLDIDWDATRARAAIAAIVEDTEETLGSGITWPWHPLDEGKNPKPPHKSIYLGASGTLWAMWYLQRAGAVSLRIKPPDLIDRVYESYLAQPDTGEVVPSYFLGEVGILLIRWRLTGSREVADRIREAIARNILNPTNEALWGAPGTMIGALHMLRWTGEERWRELYLENAEQLWRIWLPSTQAHCHLWTQDLYGHIEQLLGAGHGFAGNAYALLRGAALLPADRREALYDRCVESLHATAILEDDGANWPPAVGARPAGTKMLVQWCHGAPGIVTGLADFPVHRSADMDEMLVKAGHAIWQAGPLAKGPGVCHGTAGNGYAYLKLHQRTGDKVWLSRARSFAMHAIAQSEQAQQEHGRRRYSLWTGDPGLAVYLWHCLTGSGGLPALDILD